LRQVLEQREAVIAERTESLRQAVADLDRLSRTDALTGSLNYRGFLEAAAALWRETRATGKPLSVLALDIDHFKRYNDLYGHAEGDGALRRFAGAVSSALLHADDVLARPGGEEFIVFLPGSTLEQAMRVGERVCERVRGADIVHAASPQGRMTVSIGIAAMQADDHEPEQMLRRADAALYRAKAAGRDGVSD
jgi:diguanylate cyclase (GGDEF)-like protein